jgi:L-ribulokinase
MLRDSFVIGVDFGTDSVRSVVVDAHNGSEVAASVYHYPRWRDQLYCDPERNQFRQHPLDYVEGLEHTIRECLKSAGEAARKSIKGISVDTTGSTPVAVNKAGTPLSLLPQFSKNPNAMFVLWKDHTAVKEAQEINDHAAQLDINYLKFVGGIYSSEWFWAKLLHALRVDESVRNSIHSWVEHCDWIPFMLTGGSDVSGLRRGVCSAGHKALWSADFGGLPPDDFFASLDPLLKGFTSRLFAKTYTSDQPAGTLSREWSERLGLSTGVVVGIGAFDCHMGAVGGQIEPYFLSKVMGTSTCDMMVIPRNEMKGRLVRGICGQVDGSIIPGMIGLEAGQSAFGDTYAWYKNLLSWPLHHLLPESSLISKDVAAKLSAEISEKLIPFLSEEAARISVSDDDELAIDWLNGRRTPDADQTLTGSIAFLNLGSNAARVFKAWVESTCFGARSIAARFADEGVQPKGLIGLGGVARKSPYIMQVMADVMNMPIRIHRSEQTCALGAAMFAATASGLYPKVEEAMSAMGQGFDLEYKPNAGRSAVYTRRFQKYMKLGATFENSRKPKISEPAVAR